MHSHLDPARAVAALNQLLDRTTFGGTRQAYLYEQMPMTGISTVPAGDPCVAKPSFAHRPHALLSRPKATPAFAQVIARYLFSFSFVWALELHEDLLKGVTGARVSAIYIFVQILLEA